MTETVVRDLMTEDVFAVLAEDPLGTVCDLMIRHHVRHVPVVDAYGKLVGLVSHRDLLRHQLIEQEDLPDLVARALLERLEVRKLMTTPPETVGPGTAIRIAAQIMYKYKYGCLPVVADGKLIGILTEADFVRHLT